MRIQTLCVRVGTETDKETDVQFPPIRHPEAPFLNGHETGREAIERHALG